MKTEERGPDSFERSLIRLGGASALLVAVLPWIAILLALPLIPSGFSLLMDPRDLLLLVHANKLSFAAFLVPFLVAGFAILPLLLAIFLRFKKAPVVLGALLWGAGTFLIEVGVLLYMGLLPLSDRLVAAGSTIEETAVVATAEAIRWSAQSAFAAFEVSFGIAVLLFGWAMLKSGFPRWLGYLGLGTGIVHLGVAVAEVVPGLDFILLFDLVFNVWFLGVGVALLRGR
ncbi:MAG: hypothetical protein ACE5LS_00845 [Thermoplasmata archaeon]